VFHTETKKSWATLRPPHFPARYSTHLSATRKRRDKATHEPKNELLLAVMAKTHQLLKPPDAVDLAVMVKAVPKWCDGETATPAPVLK